jgi:hypothetical protein
MRYVCDPAHHAVSNNSHSVLIFKGINSIISSEMHILIWFLLDITVELASRDDCFLTDICQLILEVKLNGQNVDKVNLLSQESASGVWNADRVILL